MKDLTYALLLFLLFACADVARAQVAVVDIQQVLQDSPLLEESQARLRARFARVERALTQADRELADLRTKIDLAEAQGSPELAALRAEYQSRADDYQRLQVDYRRDLDSAQSETREIVRQEVARVAGTLARARGLSAVVERGSVVYSEPATQIVDLTEPVIAALARRATPDPQPESTPEGGDGSEPPEGSGGTRGVDRAQRAAPEGRPQADAATTPPASEPRGRAEPTPTAP